MNTLATVSVVVMALAAFGSAIVVPEGVQWPEACKTTKCSPGFVCVEVPSAINPLLISHTRCVRRPSVLPAFRSGNSGMCPKPSGVGICAFMCGSDEECRGIRKCCKNGCGGTVCMNPVPRTAFDF